jgi:flavin-dependent dehydrogenase
MGGAFSHDVAVVGGGPAGAAAGAWLAQRGKRVVILEREEFPRFSIGESLLPHGNDLLRQIGVWQKLEEAGFLQKFGAEFCTADKRRMRRFWFGRNLGPTHEYSFQVERAKFDQLLLEHARESGCDVLQPARGLGLEADREGVILEYEKAVAPGESAPTRGVLRARWLMDASGRGAFAAHRLGIPRESTQPTRRVAVYGHFRGVFRNEGKAAGHITIVRSRDGWFWMIPLAGGITSVGLVLPVGAVSGGVEPRAVFEEAVESAPEVRDRMREAEAVGGLRSTGDYSWRHASFSTERVLLVGDAAGFVDPIFSSGVMLALKSALRASDLVVRADAAGRCLEPGERRAYTREVSGWMREYTRMIGAFYDRAGFEVFMTPAEFFQIPASVGRLVGGFARPGLADRLRLEAFYLLCRLQRFLSLVPAIEWSREAHPGH